MGWLTSTSDGAGYIEDENMFSEINGDLKRTRSITTIVWPALTYVCAHDWAAAKRAESTCYEARVSRQNEVGAYMVRAVFETLSEWA